MKLAYHRRMEKMEETKLWRAVKDEFVGLTTTGTSTGKSGSATKPNHAKPEETSSTPAPVRTASVFGIADVTKASSTPETVGTEEDCSNSNGNNDNDEEELPSQVSWSQSDEQIYRLDRGGELNQVVGAGSMLSQELTMVRASNEHESDEEEDEDQGPETQESAFGSIGLGLSQATDSSINMAERLGILTQPEEDDGSGGDEEEPEVVQSQPPKKEASSQPFSLALPKSEPSSKKVGPQKLRSPERRNGDDGTKPAGKEDDKKSGKSYAMGSPQAFSITAEGKNGLNGSAADRFPAAASMTGADSCITTPRTRSAIKKESATGETFKSPEIRDTPIRQSECFGSLLEAVQVIASQDEEELALQLQFQQSQEETTDSNRDVVKKKKDSRGKISLKSDRPSKRKAPTEISSSSLNSDPSASRHGGHAAAVAAAAAITNIRNGTNKIADKIPSSNGGSAAKRPRKTASTAQKQAERTKVQNMAQRAASLAEQTVSNPDMAKKLLLSMALVRENPRTAPATWPPRGSVIPEGFFWAHYPPLEGGEYIFDRPRWECNFAIVITNLYFVPVNHGTRCPAVLKQHMAEYYDLSTTKCQSAQQQAFNNDLVVLIRDAVAAQGWVLEKSFECDKVLRDRIRCYYKTHIQNAKKRLRTMVRNPTKRANARHLCAHMDLIEQSSKKDEEDAAKIKVEDAD